MREGRVGLDLCNHNIGNELKHQLTNRKSRGPCSTDALIVEVLECPGRCIGAISSTMAEGAIVSHMTAGRGM